MPRKLFQPGRSGNPNGRLPNGSTISDHLRDLLKRSYGEVQLISKYLEEKGERKLGSITAARLVACRLIILSVEGHSEIVRQVLDRTEGRVPEVLLTGSVGDEMIKALESGRQRLLQLRAPQLVVGESIEGEVIEPVNPQPEPSSSPTAERDGRRDL